MILKIWSAFNVKHNIFLILCCSIMSKDVTHEKIRKKYESVKDVLKFLKIQNLNFTYWNFWPYIYCFLKFLKLFQSLDIVKYKKQ